MRVTIAVPPLGAVLPFTSTDLFDGRACDPNTFTYHRTSALPKFRGFELPKFWVTDPHYLPNARVLPWAGSCFAVFALGGDERVAWGSWASVSAGNVDSLMVLPLAFANSCFEKMMGCERGDVPV